jgi:anti-sigma factor RsiW
MHEPWTERLSDYLDDELSVSERAALEAHLAGCRECAATLAELRQVVAAAATLPDRPPERDLWPAIAVAVAAERRDADGIIPLQGRSGRRGAGRRYSFSLPQLAAAGVVLALLSGGTALVLLDRAESAGSAVAVAESRAASAAMLASLPGPAYESAVLELERILEEGRDRLEPETVRVLEENLRIIDDAIAEARRAIETDPANGFLGRHLTEHMRRKLDLLRMASEMVVVQT